MGEVISLPFAQESSDDEWIWQCQCGATMFALYADGRVECYVCGQVSQEMICGHVDD